jgi:hypothetical protein
MMVRRLSCPMAAAFSVRCGALAAYLFGLRLVFAYGTGANGKSTDPVFIICGLIIWGKKRL